MFILMLRCGLRIGEVQMASGAGASDVTATIIGVVSAYGLPHCEVDVIYTSITVSCYRGTEQPPITLPRAHSTARPPTLSSSGCSPGSSGAR